MDIDELPTVTIDSQIYEKDIDKVKIDYSVDDTNHDAARKYGLEIE